MKKRKLSFNLDLSNRVYKASSLSLIQISNEACESIVKQNEEFLDFTREDREDWTPNDWLQKGSHISNIEWLLLNSIYISMFSSFEHHIYSLVRIIEDRHTSEIELNDFAGNGITKYCKYLHLVGSLDSAASSKSKWQQIDKFQKVRNILAHNGGTILKEVGLKLKDDPIYGFLAKNKVIMAGSFGNIRIRNISFLESFNVLTSKISDELTAEIDLKYPVSK